MRSPLDSVHACGCVVVVGFGRGPAWTRLGALGSPSWHGTLVPPGCWLNGGFHRGPGPLHLPRIFNTRHCCARTSQPRRMVVYRRLDSVNIISPKHSCLTHPLFRNLLALILSQQSFLLYIIIQNGRRRTPWNLRP